MTLIVDPRSQSFDLSSAVDLSEIGISLPVVDLYLSRIMSEICSSFACSTALHDCVSMYIRE